MRIQIIMTLPREAASVPFARHTVSAALRSAGVTRDCLGEVEVALSEACTNVFHHAADTDNYEVVIDIGEDDLTLHVTDTGLGFVESRPATFPEHSAEEGRGLALMAALTDSAVFDAAAGDGGTVRLVKHLRWDDDALLRRPSDPLSRRQTDPA